MKRKLYYISFVIILLVLGACSKSEDEIDVQEKEDISVNWLIGDWVFTTDVIKGYRLSFRENGDYYDDISHNNPDEGLVKKGTYQIKKENGILKIEAHNPDKNYIYCYEILRNDDSSMDIFFYLEYFRGPRKGEKNHNMDRSRKIYEHNRY